jgi:hypothetical protein
VPAHRPRPAGAIRTLWARGVAALGRSPDQGEDSAPVALRAPLLEWQRPLAGNCCRREPLLEGFELVSPAHHSVAHGLELLRTGACIRVTQARSRRSCSVSSPSVKAVSWRSAAMSSSRSSGMTGETLHAPADHCRVLSSPVTAAVDFRSAPPPRARCGPRACGHGGGRLWSACRCAVVGLRGREVVGF